MSHDADTQRDKTAHLISLGWVDCSGRRTLDGCWHHWYFDPNDWHSLAEALECSHGKEQRLRDCINGIGPDWSGYADEYDSARLTLDQRERRAAEARTEWERER